MSCNELVMKLQLYVVWRWRVSNITAVIITVHSCSNPVWLCDSVCGIFPAGASVCPPQQHHWNTSGCQEVCGRTQKTRCSQRQRHRSVITQSQSYNQAYIISFSSAISIRGISVHYLHETFELEKNNGIFIDYIIELECSCKSLHNLSSWMCVLYEVHLKVLIHWWCCSWCLYRNLV